MQPDTKLSLDQISFSDDDMNLEEDYYTELENGKVRNGNGED